MSEGLQCSHSAADTSLNVATLEWIPSRLSGLFGFPQLCKHPEQQRQGNKPPKTERKAAHGFYFLSFFYSKGLRKTEGAGQQKKCAWGEMHLHLHSFFSWISLWLQKANFKRLIFTSQRNGFIEKKMGELNISVCGFALFKVGFKCTL